MRYLMAIMLTVLAFVGNAQTKDTDPDKLDPGIIPVKVKEESPAPVVYPFVDRMPTSPPKEEKYFHDKLKNFVFDKETMTSKLLVSFIVNEDGHLSDTKIVKGKAGEAEKEIINMVNNMPPWKPGMLNGKNVKVYFSMSLVIDRK